MNETNPKSHVALGGRIKARLIAAILMLLVAGIALNFKASLDPLTTHIIVMIALVLVGFVLASVLISVQGVKNNAVELDQLREDLEQQVRLQTQDIRAARDDAENASRAKSEFLSSMSHELRTPLNAIMGFAQLMDMDNAKKQDDPNYKESVCQILESSSQLLELIDQLLDMSSIENGELIVALEDVPVAPIVDDCIAEVQEMARCTSVCVERANGPDDPDCQVAVRADAAMVRQALKNLLSNAIKYNTEGGRVTVMCTVTDDGRVRVSVQDDGVGIPTAVHSQVFHPFTRLGQEGSAISGTGVGLTLTKKLITAMGGEIGFVSQDGEGSTFWMDFPLCTQSTEPPAAPLSPAKSSGPYLTLYVEDSSANAALMEQYFKFIDDVELVVAVTGEKGLEVAFERQPDLILMDVNLPGISGTEAMLELRQSDGPLARVPIIALSADAMTDEISKALKAGFDAYLTKPMHLQKLKETIGQYLLLSD